MAGYRGAPVLRRPRDLSAEERARAAAAFGGARHDVEAQKEIAAAFGISLAALWNIWAATQPRWPHAAYAAADGTRASTRDS